MRYIILFFIILSTRLYGQNLKAGAIHLDNLSGNTFRVKAKLAIEWPVSINKPYLKINWGDGSPIDSLNYSGSYCTGNSSTTLEYWKDHTFSPNNSFTLSVTDSFLVSGIYNIPNSSAQKLFLHTVINTQFLPNSQPVLSYGCLTDSAKCCDVPAYNPGAIDLEGDSLSFALDSPPFITNYILPPVNINALIGTITFTSNTGSPTCVTMRIDEWRKISGMYNLISSSYNELYFDVHNTVGIIQQEKENSIKCYPNPTLSLLHISDEQNDLQNASIEISNSIGQSVMQIPFQESIDVSRLPEGCYFIMVTTQQGQRLRSKFVKY